MRVLKKTLFTAAALAGLAFGGMALGNAVTGPSLGDTAEVPDENVVVMDTPPLLIEPTSGREEPNFEAQVASSDNGSTSHLVEGMAVTILDRSENGDVCYSLQRADSLEEGCYSEHVIRTGMAYSAAQAHPDDPIVVVGIVPDSVDSVQIGESQIQVVGNIWTYTGKSGEIIAPIVSSQISGSAATIGG
ncbi:MAG: hypothetical protein ACN4GZ_15840 [Acidimicrobiales bacterium]